MYFNEFYQYLHAIQQAGKPPAAAPDRQAEALNDLFLFLHDNRTQIFPESLCTKAIQYLRYFVEDILPHLGYDPTAQQEIARQYAVLITHLTASTTAARQIEQELGQIIKKLRDGVADLDHEFTGTLLSLFQQWLTPHDTLLAALHAKLPAIREKYTEQQIGDLFDQFLHVLTVEKPEIVSQPELSNLRELFGYILRAYFAGNTVLIQVTTGQGRIVPLRVLVDWQRASAHVEFWHHTVDADMQASADIARSLARKYLLEEFERDLPEQVAVCCQFLYPAEGYRDASASLMIGLQMVGEVLGLEGDPQTVVTGAVDQYGNVLGVGWIPQKFNAIREYAQIARLLLPERDVREVAPIQKQEPSQADSFPQANLVPVRTFAEAVEQYYGRDQLHACKLRERRKVSWQQVSELFTDITNHRMSTVRGKYRAQLYLQREQTRQTFAKFLASPEKKCFILIGKSGVGKSNFLLSLYDEFQSIRHHKQAVLMYDGATLRVEPSITVSITQGVNDRLQASGRQIDDIWQAIQQIDGIAGRLVIVYIDAINENPDAKNLLKQVNELIQKPFPWLKVVCTSRPKTWQVIKRRVRLAESLYYREEGAETIGVELTPFSYSEQMEPFSRQELPQAYAKYQEAYHLQTTYQELPQEIRAILQDPLSLWLAANTYQSQTIPATLKATELIAQYVQALTVSERLQPADLRWLETQFVPLLVQAGQYCNTLPAAELETIGIGREDQIHRSLTNLLDTDIPVRRGEGGAYALAFKYERFYEYFVGQRIFESSAAHADLPTFYQDVIQQVNAVPFLWGAIKSALIQEIKAHGFQTVRALCFSDQQRVKEMMINVLTDVGREQLTEVEQVLESILPGKERLSTLQSILALFGKVTLPSPLRTRSAQTIAIETASHLNLPRILQTAALHFDPSIRTTAVRAIYHLWQRDQEAGFNLLQSLAQKVTRHWIPHLSGFETLYGLSLVIFFDHPRDPVVSDQLQGVWRKILNKILFLHESESPWNVFIRNFIREQLLSIVMTLAFQILKEMPRYGCVNNVRELDASFRSRSEEQSLYRRLLQYLNVYGDYSKEQMETDFLTALNTKNTLIEIVFNLGLSVQLAHTVEFLPFLKTLLTKAQAIPFITHYIGYIIGGFEVFWGEMLRESNGAYLFTFFLSTLEIFQEYCAKYPHKGFVAPEANFLGPYIFLQYHKTGSIKTEWLQTRIDNALRSNHFLFFDFLIKSELALVGIELKQPRIALDTLALFFDRRTPELEKLLQQFLARMRIYYPDDVDDFLEKHLSSEEFRLQVQNTEVTETIGELIGYRSWYFLRELFIKGSSPAFYCFVHVLDYAAECTSLREWAKYFLSEVVNLIYGEDILHQTK